MNSQYKGFNGPKRYSTRKQLFGNRETPSKQSQNTEILKLEGKMRSIQEDIKVIRCKNQTIEQENGQIVKCIEELEDDMHQQAKCIEELQFQLQSGAKQNDQFVKYEHNLKTVGQKINGLNQVIQHKNEQFTHLTFEKRRLQNQRKVLKEQANLLLYNQNIFYQETNHILLDEDCQNQNYNDEEDHEDLTHRVMNIISLYQTLKGSVQSKRKAMEDMKKETKDMIMNEKQKRIQLEFKVKLLKERRMDQEKQKQYYKGCYDEGRIQEVINEMLVKQDQIRQRIANQIQATRVLKEQSEDSLPKLIKKLNRDRQERSQQIKTAQSKNEMLMKEIAVVKTQSKEFSSKLSQMQAEDLCSSEYVQEGSSEIWLKIKHLQQQNVALQSQYNHLNSEVQMLQKQLIF